MSKSLCDLSGGELATSPFAAILIEALRIRVSGELIIEAKGGISRVYFRNGQPCGAEVFFGFKPLGQFLLEIGWIDIRALERSLVAVADGRKQGEALVALGCLTEEQLSRGLALHHLGHLRSLSFLTKGSYRFTQREALPAWTDEIQISAHRAILDALGLTTGASVCRRILRAAAGLPDLRMRPGWERYAGYFHLDEAEGLFVSKLEAPRSLSAILAMPGLEQPRAYALTSALFLMGILAPAPKEDSAALTPLVHTPVPEVTPGPATPGPTTPGPVTPGPEAEAVRERRIRMMHRAFDSMGVSPFSKEAAPPPARLRLPPEGDTDAFARWTRETLQTMGGLSPYAMLGLEEGADAEQVKRAYIHAAKRLHPDRIPPALEGLRDEIRRIFVAIGEAYETLRSGRHDRDNALAQRFEALYSRGLAALAGRRWEEAAQALFGALELRRTPDLQAHALWAAYQDPKGRAAERVKVEIERLYEAFPESDVVCYYSGALARLEGDFARAEERFRAAVERNPEHREARQELRLLEAQKSKRGPLGR